MRNKMKSRKFWISVVGAVVLVLVDGLGIGIDREVILAAAGVIISFVLGESYIDSKKST